MVFGRQISSLLLCRQQHSPHLDEVVSYVAPVSLLVRDSLLAPLDSPQTHVMAPHTLLDLLSAPVDLPLIPHDPPLAPVDLLSHPSFLHTHQDQGGKMHRVLFSQFGSYGKFWGDGRKVTRTVGVGYG